MNEHENTPVLPDADPVNAEDSTSNAKLTGDPSDYKLIVDLTKKMKESCDNLRNTVHSALSDEGLNVPDVLEDIVLINKDIIDSDESADLIIKRNYLREHSKNPDEYTTKLADMSDKDVTDLMKSIHDSFITVHKIEQEYRDILTDSKDILNEYFNYINSNRVTDSIKKRLELMKSANELEVANDIKAKNEKLIKTLETTLDLSFMDSVIIDVDKLVDQFFKDNLSAYIVKKFKSKIKKYGYNDEIYRYFFDIEENFLEEKYHPFNNLFLFIYMKYVGYSDPYNDTDGMYVRSITGSLANLIYHRFETSEDEKNFIKFISAFLDRFVEGGYTERFILDNVSYKGNNENIMAVKAVEDQKIDYLKKKLDYYQIEYSDDMSLDELTDLFNEEYNKLEEAKISESTEESDEYVEKIDKDLKVGMINNAINNIKYSQSEDEEDERSEDE